MKIARTWTKGDVVELQFPMAPRVVRGFETEFPAANRGYFDFEPAAVFQPRRLPYASVLYGPLLFALPIPDVDPNTPAKDARWQYALDADAAARERRTFTVERKPMPAHWDWPLDAPLRAERAGPGLRLAADRRPGAARQAGRRETRAGNDPSRSLRLHQVPHLDVSRDAAGYGRRGESGVADHGVGHATGGRDQRGMIRDLPSPARGRGAGGEGGWNCLSRVACQG